MSLITAIQAEHIADSRKRPTIRVHVRTSEGSGSFDVPSGASTGTNEACELRDADGGVTAAIHNIQEVLAPALVGMDAADQRAIDEKMIALDGTALKNKLGGNALIGVSIANAKAAASDKGVETFKHLRTLADIRPSRKVPYLYMNFINGGMHAKTPLAFQEHMLLPDVESVSEALTIVADVEMHLRNVLTKKYGVPSTETMGDEGGYVIDESNAEIPFQLLLEAIESSGNTGKVQIAIDVAASSFWKNGTYDVGGKLCPAAELSAVYTYLSTKYPILSIEDPFEEAAWEDFADLQKKLPSVRVVGDDLTVTNAKEISKAGDLGAIKAVIIKPNQVGTLSETLDAMKEARKRDIDCIVSHRSGDTMDTFIADLALAFGAFGMKAGTLRRPERRVKYERLAEISLQ